MDNNDQPTTIVKCLDILAQKKPDKPAFIFVDKHLDRFVLTRKQLRGYCGKFAATLKRKDLGKGRVVCNTLGNSPLRVITEFGAISAGAISMTGQTCRADGADFMNSLKVGEANAIIFDSEDSNSILSFLKPKLDHYDEKTGRVSCSDVPSLQYLLDYSLKAKHRFFESLDKEMEEVFEDMSTNDVCQYLCTSGSTSFFKLVAFSSRCLLEYGKRYAEIFKMTEDDVNMNNRTLSWLGGYPAPYLVTGSTRVIMDAGNGKPNDFADFQWKMAVQEQCTVSYTSPLFLTEFNKVRESSEDVALRTYKMRTVGCGGGPVTNKQVKDALGNIAENVMFTYASTEAGFTTSTIVTKMDEFEEFKTGLPTSGSIIKVVDKEGKELPSGERGEILIQSSQRALYYVNDPEKTSQTFGDGGWIRLGDIGMLNPKGELIVVGRDKFAIMKGIFLFYPDTIESFLRECPGIKDVAITGVPDDMLFHQICALIIKETNRELSADDVLKYCREASVNTLGWNPLAPIPKYFLFVDCLPISGTGKLLRNEVRDQACDLLGLTQSHK